MTATVLEMGTDDVLAHYGVAGMKWGKHKGKPTTADIHQARYRQGLRLQKAQEAQGDFIVARTNKGKDKAEKIMRQREKEYFNNPDAALANKLTKGEKWAVGLTYGSLGAMAITAVISGAAR